MIPMKRAGSFGFLRFFLCFLNGAFFAPVQPAGHGWVFDKGHI